MKCICKICGKEEDLRTHLKIHKISSKDYYNLYLKQTNEGLCKICGKETHFLGISKGYRTYCCATCQQNDPDYIAKRVKSYKKSGCGNEKRRKTWANKSKKEINEIQTKIRATCKEKYNTEFYSQSKEWKENVPKKISEAQKELIKNNLHHTQKNGYINPFSLVSVITKIKETKLKNHNNANYVNTKKFKQTCLKKYNCENPMQNHDIFKKSRKKYTYDNQNFDSKPELCYYIWLKDNNIDFEYQPNYKFTFEYDNETREYWCDFKVGNEYQEIKGLQFFENKNPNGKMICPYHKKEDTKEIIKWRNGLFEAKHQCMLNNNIKIITDYNEYEKYVNEKYTKDFISLFRNDLEFPYLNENLIDKSDMGLIHHFHKSIYEASKKNKLSPIQAWNDKNIILKTALNRLKYVGKCKPNDILQGFTVTQYAPKISVFKPKLAEELIIKYLNDYETIFDPFSGFSGRMIGCMNCNKKYIGQDIHEGHVKESNEIISYKKYENCIVNVQNILTDTHKEYDCLFTCPPYGGKEHWNKNNDEIEKSCDEWIELCLNKYNCKKYLFVVDKTENYKNYIVETIENKSHFGSNFEYIVLIKKE